MASGCFADGSSGSSDEDPTTGEAATTSDPDPTSGEAPTTTGDDSTTTSSTGPDSSTSDATTTASTTGDASTSGDTSGGSSSDDATTGDSSGGADPVCGDGEVSGDEVCDDGTNAGETAGDCAPDCSVVVVERIIRLSQVPVNSNFGGVPNPVVYADAQCDPGFTALFVDGTNRVASVTPYTGDGQVDWVLQPWTEYVNSDGQRIWTTTDLRLLGVDDAFTWQGLENPVTPSVNFGRTGMVGDYTTSTADCNGWTGGGGTLAFAQTQLVTPLAIGIPDNDSGGLCGSLIGHEFICVEQ